MMGDNLEILSVAITNRCNLKCIYCGRNEDKNNDCLKDELSNEAWLKVFSDAKKIGLKKVNMSGGEIFVRKDIVDLIKKTIDLGLTVSIETNGTIITEKQIVELSKYKNNISVSISLDGIKEKTNDLTRGQGSYKKALNTIKLIKENNIPLRIITVLSKNNYNEIPELASKIHEELGLGFRLLPTIIEYGRGVEANETEGIKYKDLKKLMDDFYFDFLRTHKNDLNLTVELNIALIPLDIYSHNLCPWGKSMLGIGYNGNVALCHVSSDNDLFIFDNINKSNIIDIWEHNEKLKRFKDFKSSKLKGICGNCLARNLCRGGCRLYALSRYNGDFYSPNPQCQDIYDIGEFPEYAMIDVKKDCHYNCVVEK